MILISDSSQNHAYPMGRRDGSHRVAGFHSSNCLLVRAVMELSMTVLID